MEISMPCGRHPVSFVVAIVLFFAFSCSAYSQSGFRISSVEFQGNTMISSDELEEELLFPPGSWFGVTIMGDDAYTYSRGTIQREVESLKRFYRTKGFLHVQISGLVSDQDDGSETVELLYVIEERDPVLVRGITITDSSSADPPDTNLPYLHDVIVLEQGSVFEDEILHQDADRLIGVLNNGGFPYASLDHSLELNQALDSVDIGWGINRGPFSYFGRYSISGVEKYNEALITDRIAFRKGEAYDRRLLEKTQRDIYDLGLYRIVSVKASLQPTRPTEIPVLLSVREASRYRLQMGIGYGRDEEFRISARLDILGILGTAGQVGLEVRRSALEPITVFVSYTHPDFLIPKTRFTVRPFLRREDEPGHEARRKGYDLGFARPLWTDWFASLKYAGESVDMLRTPNVDLPPNFRSDYPKESIIFTLGYDSSEPLFDPSKGISTALSYTNSGLEWFQGEQYQFGRVLYDFRWFFSPTGWNTIAWRIKLGTHWSHEDPKFIPFEERLYAGGSISVRGWGRALLGPLDADGNPVGGNSLLETSLELRFPRGSTITGVIFADAGNVWGTTATYKPDDLGYSLGAGLRYATPVGPLRLDIAHPVGRGGQRVQWWFSIGHAF